MIDLLDNIALSSDELHEEVEFLIKDFVPKKMITVFYADGGSGKTWLSYGIAAYLCTNNLCDAVYYLDFDNGMVTLKERNVDDLLIGRFDNLRYIQRSKVEMSPLELLEGLSNKAVANAYRGLIFLVDSLRDIDDIRDDRKAMRVMNMLKNIREAGATIIGVAHANKNGVNYEGSSNIKNSLDCMFKLRKLPSPEGRLHLALETIKERGGITDCAFSIETKDLTLNPIDLQKASLTETEKEFLESIQKVLKKYPDGVKQGKLLLEAVNKKSTDKPTMEMLKKFIGDYYTFEGTGNSKVFKII